MNTQTFRIAVIDDDPFVIRYVTEHLDKVLPDAEVVGIGNPVAPLGFDVYIVDREFGADSCGQELVQRIKNVAPGSLVIAYSAFLDREFLRDLVLQDCEGAFDKGSVDELEKMMSFIRGHNETGAAAKTGQGTIKSIRSLLHEWNIRLSRNGEANAKYHGNV